MKLTILLWRTANGERVPFEVGNFRNADKNIVARTKCETFRPFDCKMRHFGRQKDARLDKSTSATNSPPVETNSLRMQNYLVSTHR